MILARTPACLRSGALSDGPSGSLAFGGLFSMSLGNGLWFLAGQSAIVPASVLLRGLPGQMESVMHCSSSRAEQRVHGCQGYGRTRDIFHPSGERRKGAERTDKQRTDEEISVSRCKSGCAVCLIAKMFRQCRISLQARCLLSLAGGGVASTLPVTDLPNSEMMKIHYLNVQHGQPGLAR